MSKFDAEQRSRSIGIIHKGRPIFFSIFLESIPPFMNDFHVFPFVQNIHPPRKMSFMAALTVHWIHIWIENFKRVLVRKATFQCELNYFRIFGIGRRKNLYFWHKIVNKKNLLVHNSYILCKHRRSERLNLHLINRNRSPTTHPHTLNHLFLNRLCKKNRKKPDWSYKLTEISSEPLITSLFEPLLGSVNVPYWNTVWAHTTWLLVGTHQL